MLYCKLFIRRNSRDGGIVREAPMETTASENAMVPEHMLARFAERCGGYDRENRFLIKTSVTYGKEVT
jgi:hypothetical protein